MGTTYRFIADPAQPSEVVGWFRSLSTPPAEVSSEQGVTFYFKECGPLSHTPDGKLDSKSSPVASVILPRIRRGVLWTVGEVHFLPTPLRVAFPGLQKVSSAFSKWLGDFECVYPNESKDGALGYWLEGSVKNFDSPIYAFQSGFRALQSGRYFVAYRDTDHTLDNLSKVLRLRGVACIGA
jgi:hypothetical protein